VKRTLGHATRTFALLSAVALPVVAQPAAPDPSAATPPAAPAVASASPALAPSGAADTCVERLPEGKSRPQLREEISGRGTSGHAHRLRLVIEHGPGETVLPGGFQLQAGGSELKALENSHFFVPDPNGSAAPRIDRKSGGNASQTTVDLWLVPLPDKPGRQELTLPPLPIAIARASGELMTLCTAPHPVVVEDPIANDPNAKPKANPPGRPQIEEWTTAKYVTIAAAIALLVGALLAILIGVWRKRPKVAPPPPPQRPPWEAAMEGLYDLRHSGLLADLRFAEFYDRGTDIVRRYLGERYGYDGLESTTREALAALRNVGLPLEVWVKIQEFMQDADLVKFAKQAPTEAECLGLLDRAEYLVSSTVPSEPLPKAPVAQPETEEAGS